MAEEIRVWGSGTKGLWSFGATIDIPDGFVEVPIGNAFITRKIKQQAELVYIRMVKATRTRPSTPVAILAPKELVEQVHAEERRTWEQRNSRRQKERQYRADKESQRQAGLLEEIRSQFPAMPESVAETIVAHAFAVGSGRVGRTSLLDDRRKIELAVRAHIRHCETDYEELLASGAERDWASLSVQEEIEQIYRVWRGEVIRPPP